MLNIQDDGAATFSRKTFTKTSVSLIAIVIILKLFNFIFVRGVKINRHLGLYSRHFIFIVTFKQAQQVRVFVTGKPF